MIHDVFDFLGISELLFECYGASSVGYGIDALFSYYHNTEKTNGSTFSKDGFIVSVGHSSTHYLPILDGKLYGSGIRRLDLGGQDINEYLYALLRNKFPGVRDLFTDTRMEEIKIKQCYVSKDYLKQLKELQTDSQCFEQHSRILQLPYTLTKTNSQGPTPLSEEERKKRTEKRKQLGKKISQQAKQRRIESLKHDQEQLELFQELKREATEEPECIFLFTSPCFYS